MWIDYLMVKLHLKDKIKVGNIHQGMKELEIQLAQESERVWLISTLNGTQEFAEIFPKEVKDGLKAVERIIGEIEKIISE
jgi:hypothetical protein